MNKNIIKLFESMLHLSSNSNKELLQKYLLNHPYYPELCQNLQNLLTLNINNVNEDTPIHMAIRMGFNATMIAVLLEIYQSFLPDTENTKNCISEKIGMQHQHFNYDVINDTNNKEGCALLHIASKLGSLENVKLLLEHYHANINRYSRDLRQTPLHYALLNQQISTAKYLLSREDCSAFAVNLNNCSALFYALSFQNKELIQIILQKAQSEIWAWTFNVLNYQDKQGHNMSHYLLKLNDQDLLLQLCDLKDSRGNKVFNNPAISKL